MTISPTAADQTGTGFPDRLPLVGRRDELRVLLGALEPGSGAPITVVAGEGGVGKSRLVATIAQEAAERGWTVAHGRAFPVETGVPWAVFADAFLPVLRSMDPETLTVLSRGGERELAYLFPALGTVSPAETAGADTEEFRTRILWNFAEFLKSLAARGPLLIVLEDLQWADASSLQLLHFLGRQPAEPGIRYLCAYNETERDRSPDLIRTERSLLSMNAARLTRLEPLSHADTVELLCRTFDVDEEVVGKFGALLYGWTRGNAFFLEETLKALVQTGALHERDGTWLGWEVREPALPRSVRDAVLERTGRLSGDACTLAELIAVVGTRARFRPLATVSNLGEGALLAALEELCEQRILAESSHDGDVAYDFVHPLVRQTLYGEMGMARTRLLHATIAEALERHYGDRALAHADELAYHFARTDAPRLATKAVIYLAAAGRAALDRRADREAVEYLREALLRTEAPDYRAGENGDGKPTRETLLRDLARAFHHLGDYAEARRCWEDALTLDLEPGARARIEHSSGLAWFWSGRPDEALDAFERAETAARASDLPDMVARIRLSRGICYQETGRADEAREEIGRALERADELDDPDLEARVHRSLALLNIWTGTPADVRRHADRALELAESLGDAHVAFWAQWAIAVQRGLRGDTEEMAIRLERAREIAEQLRSPVLELWTAELSVEHHHATGDWDSGIALGERAIALARSLNQRMLLPRLMVWTSTIYLGRGDLERAGELIDEARALAGIDEDDGPPRSVHALVPAYMGTAHRHLTLGEFAEAIEEGEKGLEVAEGTGYLVWALHRLMPVIAESYLWLEDTEGAGRTAARMRDMAERLDHTLGRAWAEACEAMIRWKEGDSAGGAEDMRKAAESLEAIPMVPAAARIRRQLAGRLSEIGDREGALEQLREVHEVFARLGAETELEKARLQFREMGVRPPPRAQATGPGGMTERETEIARLVARGKSNKGVAKELGISPRTVSTHLSNIFQKLEIGSRMELADIVKEGELV